MNHRSASRPRRRRHPARPTSRPFAGFANCGPTLAGAIVNLGIDMPEGVGAIVAEELTSDLFTLTFEPGVIGGVPASGLDFGAAVKTDAIIHQSQQF
jgi:acyl CoA:acetate/3-ketoacid CoA transferase